MQSRILQHLEALVSFDTQNPPRNITVEHEIFDYLRRKLGASFNFEMTDLGDGCVYMLATRGTPKILFNFHVDTVPAANNYSFDPLTLRVEEEVAVGLGACDIKGASACMLAALEELPDADVALLFSSDEEFGSSACIRHFTQLDHAFELAIIAEPTNCKAVFEHRGIMTGTGIFKGVSGHASSGLADSHSALHHALAWSHEAMEYARSWDEEAYGPLSGICFNIGRVEGGIKPNMIADETTIRFGFRPLPQTSNERIFDHFANLTRADTERETSVEFQPGFNAPALPITADVLERTRKTASSMGFEAREAVNFWTEASLFSQAGYEAFVYGPGDIAQAHTADEFVAIRDLEEVVGQYMAVLEG